MTEPLTRLLHDVGDDLQTPPAPATAVLERGRSLRRRRTALLTAGASVAVVAVLTGALLLPGSGADRAVDPVAPSGDPTFAGVTYAVGNEVFLDGGETAVEIDDRAVKSLYYTSAGVLVRHGENSSSDGGGPQRFTLIRPDGTTDPVSVETEENAHGADPTQPYLAWTEVVDGGVEVVVHDVDTDTEVARVPVEGRFTWSPPPVALDGDTVYVGGRSGRDPALLAVDWRTGEVTESALEAYFPEVSAGRAVTDEGVVDVDGSEVLPARGQDTFIRLAPDSRLAVVRSFEPGVGGEVIDLDTGEGLPLPAADGGWSVGNQPFEVVDGVLTVCSPTTGECLERAVDLPAPDVPEQDRCTPRGGCVSTAVPVEPDIRYGGVLYES